MNYSLGNMLSRSGRVAFNPLSLSPALWLSDTGSNAAQWDDLSGNGRHATQATGASQPSIVTSALNGRQIRRFDGVNDFLSTAQILAAQPFTSIVALKTTETGVIGRPSLGEDSTSATGSVASASRRNTGAHVLFAGTALAGGIFGNNWLIRSDIANSVSSFIFANGQQVATGDAGTRFNIRRIGGNFNSGGASDFFLGDIAEILIFPRVLTVNERQRVERYLSNKYSIDLA
jgi:hypothetical protein